jgi:hypothetical protein
MNNSTPGAIIKFDENGNVAKINIIANSDTETAMVQQRLKSITKPSIWALLKLFFPGG